MGPLHSCIATPFRASQHCNILSSFHSNTHASFQKRGTCLLEYKQSDSPKTCWAKFNTLMVCTDMIAPVSLCGKAITQRIEKIRQQGVISSRPFLQELRKLEGELRRARCDTSGSSIVCLVAGWNPQQRISLAVCCRTCCSTWAPEWEDARPPSDHCAYTPEGGNEPSVSTEYAGIINQMCLRNCTPTGATSAVREAYNVQNVQAGHAVNMTVHFDRTTDELKHVCHMRLPPRSLTRTSAKLKPHRMVWRRRCLSSYTQPRHSWKRPPAMPLDTWKCLRQ